MKKILSALTLSLALASCGTSSTQTAAVAEQCDTVKNVIFMIGDGMGLAQASMFMIENGYKPTAFDRSENVALIKTYSSSSRITDSAAAGTALACGSKTNNGMIGLTPELDTCISLTDKVKIKGMSTGVIAACEIQHATPAAFYAHVKSRKDNYNITRQLTSSTLDLAVGGGAKYFEEELDGVKFADIATKNGFAIASNMDEFASCGDAPVLGLFESGHIKSMTDGRGDFLPKATQIALDRLSKNEKGFFLMVEGSQIDWECHGNRDVEALAEVKDFNECLNLVMDFADQNPGTLVVITADHETGGLSMVADKDDEKRESGVEYKFSTGSHSGILVPVYTYGANADKISGVMENTELSAKIGELLSL